MVGGNFSANLSRVGEKDNYDYLVRWIHNPRQRTRPYSPFEKRDLGPEDYAKHNLPFVFDLDHSRSPDDGHELVVQQPTVMPNLRLSIQDARDVATKERALRRCVEASTLLDKAASLMAPSSVAGAGGVAGAPDAAAHAARVASAVTQAAALISDGGSSAFLASRCPLSESSSIPMEAARSLPPRT